MSREEKESKTLGVMFVGIGGAVATTAIAGIELLKQNLSGTEGLPLASLAPDLIADLASYDSIKFSGWDLHAADLADAAATHDVLTVKQFQAAAAVLREIKPLPGIGNQDFCVNIEEQNAALKNGHRAAVEIVSQNIREFRRRKGCERAVIINLASTEKLVDKSSDVFATLSNFEKALDDNSTEIAPAMIYAYAAISEGAPYANFTPSVAADIPALVELAEQTQTPIAGKDGKTGQTMIKTALAPAFKTRALKVAGWYSTNLLGNRDGLALSDPESLKSKIATKSSVLDDILGYKVEDHIVDIRFYRPRGDDKEAWDNIDVVGFLGQPMQLKINFLCKDSILAAPLVIEIARLLDLAKRRGEAGVQEALSMFFKLPQVADEKAMKPIHALHAQEIMLLEWLSQQKENAKGK
jgi:myo-inositol-1-phosphate synthase